MQATSEQDGAAERPPAARLSWWAVWTTGDFAAWLSLRVLIFIFVIAVGINSMYLGSSRTCCVFPRASLYLYQDSTGIVVEADERPGGSLVATATYWVIPSRSGIPLTFRSEDSHSLGIVYKLSAVPGPNDRATVAAFLASSATDPKAAGFASFAPFAGRIAAGNFAVTTWHGDGVVIDVAAWLLVIGAGVLAVARVRHAYLGALRTARAAAGLCTGCGYQKAGLTGEICPECGDPVAPPTSPTQGVSA